jgi:hypothetical protein
MGRRLNRAQGHCRKTVSHKTRGGKQRWFENLHFLQARATKTAKGEAGEAWASAQLSVLRDDRRMTRDKAKFRSRLLLPRCDIKHGEKSENSVKERRSDDVFEASLWSLRR